MTLPPTLSGANISNTDRSKHMDVENKTPANSSDWNALRAQCTNVAALQCSMATPFGLPVEPEVNRTYAKLSGLAVRSGLFSGWQEIAAQSLSKQIRSPS